MKPPANAITYETPISTLWMDEKGILCPISKNEERTVDNYKKVVKIFSDLTKNCNKLCLLSYLNDSSSMDKEARNYVAAELPKYIKAHAIITSAPLQPTRTNTFIKLSMAGFPINVFTNEKEAKAWLKEYL